MIPVTYFAPDETTSPKFAFAFARGCGGTITEDLDLFPGPVALFGSPSRWPALRQAQADGRDWFYGDHGYLGRGRYYRITRNAYQHDGRGDAGPSRFQFFKRPIQPWKYGGRHILLCPNSDIYMGLHGIDGPAWLQRVRADLSRHTRRKVIVRWKHDARPIREDLENAFACVVFSSASAIDALIAGVPVVTLAPFAATVRMGRTDLSQIESPFFPDDRESFLANIAANQWTLHEILTGVAWRALQAQ